MVSTPARLFAPAAFRFQLRKGQCIQAQYTTFWALQCEMLYLRRQSMEQVLVRMLTSPFPCVRAAERAAISPQLRAGWGHISQLQTPASAKRRDVKKRVQQFARAGKQQALGQAQAAGPTAQSILSVKRTLSFNVCRENVRSTAVCYLEVAVAEDQTCIDSLCLLQVEAGTCQHPPNSTKPQNILKHVRPSNCSQPDTADTADVPTTFAACFAEAAAKDSAAGGPQRSRQNQAHVKFQANKNRGVRDGGHENFVRLASKKGKSSFTFKSKSGSSNKNPKNRKWAARKMAAESLPVAGLGADSTKEAHLVRPC